MHKPSVTENKQELRRRLRKRRRDTPPELRLTAAARAAGLLQSLPGWHTAVHVAGYLALPEELDSGPLLTAVRRSGKQVYLPCMVDHDTLQFRRYSTNDPLQAGKYGIRQPLDSATSVGIAALDILFLPLVGWNRRGTRLGMGAGYYDRALAAAKPGLLVGLGYDCQEWADLPRERWDVPMDYVLTESRLVACAAD